MAQEIEPSDIVGLVHVITEADERFPDRFGIVDRFLELLLLGKIVVGVDADHEATRLAACAAGLAPRASRQKAKTAIRRTIASPSSQESRRSRRRR